MNSIPRALRVRCWLVVMVCCGLAGPAAAAGPLDVRDFGAKGDGQSNDTAAFTKAFQAGLDVYVPAGKYLVDSFELPAKAYLHGAGAAATLILRKGQKGIFAGSHCRISNLSFTGQEKAAPKREGKPKMRQALLTIRKQNQVTIDHVSMKDYRHTGVRTDNAKDIRITDSHFEDMDWAMNIVFTSRVHVANNRVINTRRHGIQFWGNWEWKNKAMADIVLVGNYVKNGGGGPIWGTGATRVVMANNVIDGAEDIGLDLEWCDDSVITGNTVRNCRNAGIALLYACKRISITGNTVHNDRAIEGKESWWVRSGIQLSYPNRKVYNDDRGHEGVTIVGNTIHCAPGERRGVWVGSEVKNVRISDNVITGGKHTQPIKYGGHHNVSPLRIETLTQPLTLHNRSTPDKPKFK